MSAVRMVAYGVLELKPIEVSPRALFLDRDAEEIAQERDHKFENDQIRKLVNDELARYGLLLKRRVVPKGNGWRTKQAEHILLGQLIKGNAAGAWRTRQELCVGDFRECCIKAAELLDAMERGLNPEE
jgi:hypothetical protein